MFDPKEISVWEQKIAAKQTWVKQKRYKNPRLEKRKEVRKGIKAVHYDKEVKACRNEHYHLYRTRTNQLIRQEKFEFISSYKKTGGWISW